MQKHQDYISDGSCFAASTLAPSGESEGRDTCGRIANKLRKIDMDLPLRLLRSAIINSTDLNLRLEDCNKNAQNVNPTRKKDILRDVECNEPTPKEEKTYDDTLLEFYKKQNSLKCSHCGETFDDSKTKKRQLVLHKIRNRCTMCPEKFDCNFFLQEHFLKKHNYKAPGEESNNEIFLPGITGDENDTDFSFIWQCVHCERTHKGEESYLMHNIYLTRCKPCQITFPCSSFWKAHIRTQHEKAKCEHCAEKYEVNNKSKSREHQRKFKCSTCKKSFLCKNNWNVHVQNHKKAIVCTKNVQKISDDPPKDASLSCPRCGLRCPGEDSLESHLVRDVRCAICEEELHCALDVLVHQRTCEKPDATFDPEEPMEGIEQDAEEKKFVHQDAPAFSNVSPCAEKEGEKAEVKSEVGADDIVKREKVDDGYALDLVLMLIKQEPEDNMEIDA